MPWLFTDHRILVSNDSVINICSVLCLYFICRLYVCLLPLRKYVSPYQLVLSKTLHFCHQSVPTHSAYKAEVHGV